MTMIAKADEKRRLSVPGIRRGRRYLIKKQNDGWWIKPAPPSNQRVRESQRPASSLVEHLEAMRELGFSFEPLKKENVPPCRFQNISPTQIP